MTIELHQTLHGYQNGHQLLAGSTELTIGEKKLLLFQSDLSGPNVDEGFDHYLTGYPIAETGRYAFAKTWYAKEMKRPGCVWTHTLLISFSDLGRIPDFNVIESLFVRPAINDYENYKQPVTLVVEELIAKNETALELNEAVKGMLQGIYLEPDKIAVVPARNSELHQKSTLDIWSDQWPRLRRNFTFCTGALSLRTIEDKPYDLQIVPQKSVQSLERKSPNIFISHNSADQEQVKDLVNILQSSSVNKRRKFLWMFGADVDGERKNYLPLLKVFEVINDTNADLKTISKEVNYYFSNKTQARLLKAKLFGKDSILLDRFKELNIIRFLLHEEIDFVDLAELHIEERLLKLLNNHEISLHAFFDLWQEADQEKISIEFIDDLDIAIPDLLESVKTYPEISGLLVKKLTPLALTKELWELPLVAQRRTLAAIVQSDELNKDSVLAILNAQSPIILEVYEEIGDDVVDISLNWLNSNAQHTFNKEWADEISDHVPLVRKWLKATKDIRISVYKFIFNYFSFGQLRKLDFSAADLVSIYNNLTLSSQSQVFLTTALFSMALDPKLKHGETVIQLTFAPLYKFAANSQISKDYWGMVPKEVHFDGDDDDKDYGPWFPFLYMFRTPKKTSRVPDWDYCEILTRTIVNTYISRSWNRYSFLTTMNEPEAFRKAVNYCQTFNAGLKFLMELMEEIQVRKYSVSDFQKKILSSIALE